MARVVFMLGALFVAVSVVVVMVSTLMEGMHP